MVLSGVAAASGSELTSAIAKAAAASASMTAATTLSTVQAMARWRAARAMPTQGTWRKLARRKEARIAEAGDDDGVHAVASRA